MTKNILVLSDGTEISSGAQGAAIMGLTLTRSVNDGQQLTLGSACAAMLEATLLNIEPGRITAGDTLTLYTEDRSGNRTKKGVFIAGKPEHTGSCTLRITAYDRMILLDKDLTQWLAALAGWPYTLQELAGLVCDACGVALVGDDIPNGGHPAQKFAAEGVTGRQIMTWIGQAAGRFIRATADGDVEFAWYAPAALGIGPSPIGVAEATFADGCLTIRAESAQLADSLCVDTPHMTLTDDGAGNATLCLSDELLRQYASQGGMRLADLSVAPLEKVQLRQDAQDIGTVYPPDIPEAANTYIITANPLLTALDATTLLPVAQTLYEQLSAVSYTPCTLVLPVTAGIDAGSIVTVTDTYGNGFTVYVMTVEIAGQQMRITCEGAAQRDSTDITSEQTYTALSGKVLRLRTDVDGILAENADSTGRLSRLELDLSGIRGQVQSQQSAGESLQTQLTSLEQTADALSASVQTIRERGASKVTTEFGVTIDGSAVRIARSDSNMENRLDEKGMYVVRQPGTLNETVMLRADADGVVATDVSVRNYLRLGDHARFEDYTDGADSKRTACFYIGG